MSLSHILAPAPNEPAPPRPPPEASTAMPPPPTAPRHTEGPAADAQDAAQTDEQAGNEPMYTSTTTSTRRNASGSVSSVYSGNKIRHLKKDDGVPLWRVDIQYDFLCDVFGDETKCFTKCSDGSQGNTFAEIYIDAMAKSSKCSKILKEKLLQDTQGALAMAMVCLLVNVGRMNTTLNFFPEMRAQLRTYHSIPALQARQDPNAYKQLQDAPRLKSILKGATEDHPQPNTLDEVKAAKIPRTNPVNLIFVLSQFAPKISEVHFPAPRDFFDLVMRPSLSSKSRAKAFLWLIWWYLESNFGHEDTQRNPFGPGQYGEGDEERNLIPLKVPTLESLTEEQAAMENVDTEDEKHYGAVKRNERIAILASEPSPAMTALKRARKEKGLVSVRGNNNNMHSEDEASEAGMPAYTHTSAGRSSFKHETASDYTRSPSPAANRYQGNGDMRINNLLNNDDMMSETSPPRGDMLKKGPGRGNWRRNKQDPSAPNSTDRTQQPRLLPNNPLDFVNEGLIQPTTPGYHNIAPSSTMPSSFHDHVPTPSYQAQKRNRGVTQHQSAIMSHRKQQIDYTLDRRIRKVHKRARTQRELEGPILRAWKRISATPADYDSEEEQIKTRKARERADKDDDWRLKGRENLETAYEEDATRRPHVYLAGYAHAPTQGDPEDLGEEARSLAKAFNRAGRRLERWDNSTEPGRVMLRRRQMRAQGWGLPRRRSGAVKAVSVGQDGFEDGRARQVKRHRSGTGRGGERFDVQPDDEDGGGEGELDEEDRELLGEVDVDSSGEEYGGGDY
ncbi:uncharacterized protein LTR77_010192 [Saxophila tyrrhenica]|uniref:Ino eighty subunit 1 n=1 Tax=Saxophila tyrrhenica TaxID=1690608 RepID=A0AAV9NW32_9PEZI|nr:hypothetical protein LTR77_010192 [Saxophila tyrrhenica]